jgi:hypothetical protein
VTRDARDHYPTPPDAVLGLVHAVRDHGLIPRERLDEGRWLEPACGRGAILRWFDVPACRWLAMDIDAESVAAAGPHALAVVEGDSLAVDWPPGHNICSNPPFTLLEGFLRRMLQQVGTGASVICLTRSQYLDEPPRRWLRTTNTRPDYEVKLCWRISFTDDGNSDFATYSWWIWNDLKPKASTTKIWVERPKIRATYWEEFRAQVLGQGGPAQAELGL